MKKFYFVLCIIVLQGTGFCFAQDSVTFKPSGKVIARGFLDYSTGFGHVNQEKGFEITRAFLGYSYQFSRTLSGQVVIDGASGTTSSNGIEIYVRNAFLTWHDKNFNINAGLTNLLQFSTQEKYWMYRYVMKSFQDLNKMGPSVDLGFTAEYTFNRYVSADLSLTNGEGYKVVKKDNSMRYAAGLSFHPVENITLRIYGDIYNDDGSQRDALPTGITDATYKDRYALSLFGGYQDENFSGGVEYNKVYNNGFVEKEDYYGYSVYASGKIAPKWRIFARYDSTDSSSPANFTSPWNTLDGRLVVAGVEFSPLKQLRIAPNFRNINPCRGRAGQYGYISVEFNL
jgi:hypothetical protein